MKLYVKVIAFSEEDGVKSTMEEIVEIPNKARRLSEMIMGNDPEAILNGFATSAMVAATQSAQGTSAMNRVDPGAMMEASGNPNAPSGQLAEMLGFDLMAKMDEKERGGGNAGPAYPRGGRPTQTQLPSGPGTIGFGPHRNS